MRTNKSCTRHLYDSKCPFKRLINRESKRIDSYVHTETFVRTYAIMCVLIPSLHPPLGTDDVSGDVILMVILSCG